MVAVSILHIFKLMWMDWMDGLNAQSADLFNSHLRKGFGGDIISGIRSAL